MPTQNDIAYDFAALVADANHASLPADAIEGARKNILNTFGIILAASSTEPAVRALAELAQEGCGQPESAIVGFVGSATALMAVLAMRPESFGFSPAPLLR